jgi:hypothetical protein
MVAGTRVVTLLSTSEDGYIERWDIELGQRVTRVLTQGAAKVSKSCIHARSGYRFVRNHFQRARPLSLLMLRCILPNQNQPH